MIKSHKLTDRDILEQNGGVRRKIKNKILCKKQDNNLVSIQK